MTRPIAAITVAVCLGLGLAQGLAWAWLAPGVQYKVLADGRYGALPLASTHYFVGVAMFLLSGIALGALLAVGAWQLTRTRGWPMLLVLVGGSALGALLAWWLGGALAPGVDPASVGATDADAIVTAPAHTDTVLVILAQPAAVAAVYTFLVAWNGHPDLGRGPTASSVQGHPPGDVVDTTTPTTIG